MKGIELFEVRVYDRWKEMHLIVVFYIPPTAQDTNR